MQADWEREGEKKKKKQRARGNWLALPGKCLPSKTIPGINKDDACNMSSRMPGGCRGI